MCESAGKHRHSLHMPMPVYFPLMAKKKTKIMPIDLEEMITLPDAAKLIDLDQTYLRRLISTGRISGFKFGRNYLVYKQSVLAFRKLPGRGRPRINR